MAITTSAGFSPRVDLAPATALFHSLSDPTRLVIGLQLAAAEMRVADL